MLPYADQAPLGNIIDYRTPPIYFEGTTPPSPGTYRASITRVRIWRCPEDPTQGVVPGDVSLAVQMDGTRSESDHYAGTNYLACAGSGSATVNWGKLADSDGMFGQVPYRLADMLDGLSNTVAFSEGLLGPGGGVEPESALASPSLPALQVLTLAEKTVPDDETCDTGGTADSYWSNSREARWILGRNGDTTYNHHLRPNDDRWDCANANREQGRFAARSRHKGGVNVLYGDGSVHFITGSIAQATWEALATRSGREIVEY
jgi:prepilin-type processing-associated H-X9-DG protein